jgi:uncharacterized membrane protein YgaE (UPF0421/DUF939 family)
MKEEIEKLKKEIRVLSRRMSIMEKEREKTASTSYKTSKREIINREVQFLQKVYDKSGNLVTEINA